MNLTVDTSHVKDVEHGIAPPMRIAITLPMQVDMGARGADVVVYVAVGAFQVEPGVPTSDRELKAIAAEVVRRLQAVRA